MMTMATNYPYSCQCHSVLEHSLAIPILQYVKPAFVYRHKDSLILSLRVPTLRGDGSAARSAEERPELLAG